MITSDWRSKSTAVFGASAGVANAGGWVAVFDRTLRSLLYCWTALYGGDGGDRWRAVAIVAAMRQ